MPPTTYPPNLDAFLDLPVKLTVELGACHKTTQEVLRLGMGSVLVMDHRTNGQVELFVEQRLIARGEIVVIEGAPAIKIMAVK